MEISEVLSKYDTDKITHHKYGEVYNELFKKFNREDQLNILEIGTQKGGSLLAWKEYFPNAHVYGVDIVDVVPEEYQKDTVTRIISDIKEWKNDIIWDIIIDDGSHYLGDIVWVISHYCQKLKNKGTLIVEDVRNPVLLLNVIKGLLTEIKLGFPDAKTASFFVQSFDKRRAGAESSFIVALIKEFS